MGEFREYLSSRRPLVKDFLFFFGPLVAVLLVGGTIINMLPPADVPSSFPSKSWTPTQLANFNTVATQSMQIVPYMMAFAIVLVILGIRSDYRNWKNR